VLKELVARQGNGRPQSFALSDYILYGDLNHKNRLIYEALLSAYRGDYRKVLQHVQVERFYVSRRYRNASVVVEPQLAVDARLRQLTADRSLSALPSALQTINLWEYAGDLVDANRGLIEYSDLLKRPLEAYKYLLGTVENGAVALEGSNLFLDLVFIGSSNEGYLAAFKEVPEFQSFKGRMELVRVPYLLDYHVEELIYTPQVDPKAVGKHVAPHATEVASLWAVLTRMRKPQAEGYPKSISGVIDHLTPLDKAQLYALGQVPEGLSVEQSRELLAQREAIYGESEARGEARYEGRMGASPREIQTLLLNAAQSRHYACVTPLALFDEMEALCGATTVYEFLRQEPEPGGYHEHRRFVEMVRERFLDQVEEEVRTSMGLVDESQYTQLFERYIDHVSHFVRKEKLHNPVTRQLEDPDEELMREVEKTLGVSGKRDDFRQEAIGRIGAWSLSHPKEKPRYPEVFPKQFAKLRESYFEQHRKALRKLNQELLVYLTDGAEALEAEARERVELTLRNMRERFGYCDQCAKVAVGCLLRQRYAQ
jgi:predicted Ser/Thr protein kinase